MRADRRPFGWLPDGDGRSIENSADRLDTMCGGLDPHRSLDERADATGRSSVSRISDRSSNLTGDRLHHRSGQAGITRLYDLFRTDVGVIWNGNLVLERRLPGLAAGRVAQHHLRDRTGDPGAVLGAGVAGLARLEGTHRRSQKIPGTVNPILLL